MRLLPALFLLGFAVSAHAAPTVEDAPAPQRAEAAPAKGGKTGGGKAGGGSRTGGKKKKGGKKKGDSNMKIDSVNPTYGVLVYGPKPKSHKKYRKQLKNKKQTAVKKKDLPKRSVDRADSQAFGLRGGAMIHGYFDEVANDLGLGLTYRYHVWEAVGVQLDVTHHSDDLPFGTRSNTLFAASGFVMLYPWNAVSPYFLVGATGNARTGAVTKGHGGNTGAHMGMGLQLGLGKSLALEAEGRVIGWMNQKPDDPANPTAGQVTGGLLVHF